MKDKAVMLAMSLILGGCATWIPASVQEVGDNTYSISTTGNLFASTEKLNQKVMNRAEKKCEGKGFNIVKEPTTELRKTPDYVNGGYQHFNVVTTVISCNQ